MNRAHKRKIYLVLSLLMAVTAIVGLVLYALRQNINLFYTPHDLLRADLPTKAKIRVGGMVLQNTVVHGDDLLVSFKITDYKSDLQVSYRGMLPDLFREGQGVVVFGSLNSDEVFNAEQILAKHDQNYMPPELSGMQSEVQDAT